MPLALAIFNSLSALGFLGFLIAFANYASEWGISTAGAVGITVVIVILIVGNILSAIQNINNEEI